MNEIISDILYEQLRDNEERYAGLETRLQKERDRYEAIELGYAEEMEPLRLRIEALKELFDAQ